MLLDEHDAGAGLVRDSAHDRQEPLEARIVDINAMIADFAPLIQRAIGETIDLRLQLGQGKWFSRLDPTQFEAAMLNLAINARDATEGGGSLTIATGLAGVPAVPPTEVPAVRTTLPPLPVEVVPDALPPVMLTEPPLWVSLAIELLPPTIAMFAALTAVVLFGDEIVFVPVPASENTGLATPDI